MWNLRCLLTAILSISLSIYAVPPTPGAGPPVGVLTLANQAYLEEANAFPGHSVFEGEQLSTEAEGRLGIRVRHSTIPLGGKTDATLVRIGDGIHVDLPVGSVYFSMAENESMEVRAEGGLLQPASNQAIQASVTILAPKVLQVTARRGGLKFSYRQEFRNLLEGETYRIFLDAPAEPQDAAGAGAQAMSTLSKVTYFIVAVAVTGVAIWGIPKALTSGNIPISPAKP